MGNLHSLPNVEASPGLCATCAAGCTRLRPYLEGRVPTRPFTELIMLRWWDLSEQLEEDCSLCSLICKRTHDPCDAASHEHVALHGRMIPEHDFAQPPVAPTIYLLFEWSCGAKDWSFLENDKKDHLKGTIGFAHQLEPTLGDNDWNLIRHWVDECLQLHQSGCPSPDPIDLPGFEVIDCKTRQLVPGPKGAEFAALSYVWGPAQTQGVLENRTILPNPFPEKVIEDALACTCKLQIPFLWVDRYCIDQNDTSDTKQRLIQSMDKIYSAAKVTIICVAGDDASTGLPGVSTTRRVPSQSRAVIYGRKFVSVINPKNNISTSKWAKRGWTLQEGLLARRRLVFTNTQVYFQCTQSHCIESLLGAFHSDGDLEAHGGPFAALPEPRLGTQAFPSSVIGSRLSSYSITRVCNEFGKRDLTKDEDAFRACLGICSRLWEGETPAYQYCGLPFQANSDTAFAVSLLWDFNNAHGFPGYSPPARRAWGPSWSWLAWRGYMGFNRSAWAIDPEKSQLCLDIKIPVNRDRDTHEIMSTIDDYISDIKGGGLYQHWLPYLELSGWIATMRFESSYGGREDSFYGTVSCYPASGQDEVGSGRILPALWAEVLGNNQASNPSTLLSVILVAYEGTMNLHCLVIRPVGKGKAKRYERLGTCRVWYGSPEVKEVQDTHYMIVRESRTGAGRQLECRFETITLV